MRRPVNLFLYLACFLSMASSSLHAAETLRIAPTTVHASGDLQFLGHGITSLLDAQMAAAGRLARNPDEADFEIRTRLTAFGGTMVTDLALIHLATDKVALSRRNSTTDEGDVLPEITTFGDAVLTFFTERPPVPAQALPLPAARQKGQSGPSFEVIHMTAPEKGSVLSMDSGDLTGDGKREIVLVDRRDIRVMDPDLQTTLASLTLPAHENALRMDVMDTSGDGRAEIWLTAINPNTQRMRSQVLVYEKGNLRSVAGPENRFFVKSRNRLGEAVMLTRMRGFRDELFSGPVAEARLGNNRILLSESSHPEVHLFDAIPLRIRGNSLNDYLYIADNGTLSLLSDKKESFWESRLAYAGLPVSMDYAEKSGREASSSRHYFTGRTRILADPDGTESLLVLRNVEAAGRLFQRLRIFRTGSLHLLSWNGYEMEIAAETPELDGYIADFILLPASKEEPAKVILAVVKGGGDLSLSPETRFVTCALFR
ncbi:hypothetical protein OOT00_11515 [Desulfobotulus sp. H1]|uniref:VCBS repeat-containing protein n=1 Tax=Desulfobotulus pelophilus TaxID=2823377 RepID=A0ABT3NAY0_9BACT|nr:hypothetical protein [Desulfobotulus pelophilus]MCW7754612.1 hypothetical protein [Desulfobotulus pelophilus]